MMTADTVGGVWTYALDLASGLSAQGWEVVLAVLGPGCTLAQRAQAAALGPSVSLVETGLPLDWLCEIDEIAPAAAALQALAVRRKVDLVHLNGPAHAAFGRWSAPVVGVVHSSLATWWKAVRGGELPADFQARSELLRRGLDACDALIAPTAAFARDVAATYGVEPPRVVHNGRRPIPALPAERRRQVLTAGRLWDAGKNLSALDEAAALLDAPVFAAGPAAGPNGETVEARHVSLLGALPADDLRRRLAVAPIFASVPHYEPFGLAVLEAAQAGCALVLSDIPTLRELWDGVALFAPARDPVAIAGHLQALLDDATMTQALGRAARERASRYTVEAMTRGVLDAYAALTPQRVPEAVA